MDNNININQRLTSAILILLLLLSGCDMASEVISTETPLPTTTETPIPAPTITPTITPTPGLPPEIVAIFGEEVPELTKSEQGIYTAENVRWRATYENGEWEVLPRPTTGFDQGLLEAVKNDYLARPDTPDTWEGVITDLKRNPDYDPRIGSAGFPGTKTSTLAPVYGLILNYEEVSLEGQLGFKRGDIAIVGMMVNTNYPDGPFPILLGVNKGGKDITNGTYVEKRGGVRVDNGFLNKNYNNYTGKVGECWVLYYFKEENWQEDQVFEKWPSEIKEMINIIQSNPRGYMQRVTKDRNNNEPYLDWKNTDKFVKVIEEMDLEVGGDVGLICTTVNIFTP